MSRVDQSSPVMDVLATSLLVVNVMDNKGRYPCAQTRLELRIRKR